MHGPPIPDSTDAEIDAFAGRCEQLAGFGVAVNSEWMDGFLTAAAAGPRRVPLEECLDAAFGTDFGRVFADPQDLAQASADFAARYRVLLRQLDPEALLDEPDQLRLRPLLLEPDEGAAVDEADPEVADARTDDEVHRTPGGLGQVRLLAADWALGFHAALDAFESDWPKPDDTTDPGRDAMQAIAAIARLMHDDEAADREALVDEAAFAVQDLRLYWLDHAPRPATLRLGERPGRNDPCPCGSGRKFKKCHGAAGG